MAKGMFLVWGHSKNACNRIFNLLKTEYQKTNIFMPTDIIPALNVHRNLTAILILIQRSPMIEICYLTEICRGLEQQTSTMRFEGNVMKLNLMSS